MSFVLIGAGSSWLPKGAAQDGMWILLIQQGGWLLYRGRNCGGCTLRPCTTSRVSERDGDNNGRDYFPNKNGKWELHQGNLSSFPEPHYNEGRGARDLNLASYGVKYLFIRVPNSWRGMPCRGRGVRPKWITLAI